MSPRSNRRAMRFCTVPRDTFSLLANAAAGSRALARSKANRRRSSSSIVSPVYGSVSPICYAFCAYRRLFVSSAVWPHGEVLEGVVPVQPVFLMTDVRHFGVTYQINPWMRPDAWQADPAALKKAAGKSAAALRGALQKL